MKKLKFLPKPYWKEKYYSQSDVEALIGKRPYEEKKLLEDDDDTKTEKDKHDTGVISEGVPP